LERLEEERDVMSIEGHPVVSREQWLEARKALLAKEKEFTLRRDELSRERRELPWVKVERNYVFEGPRGKESLSDLFGKKSQLVVYHFMFGPDWDDGCPNCSFWADNFDPIIVHLAQRDVSMVAISRAAYEKLARYQKRMGWSFKWLSSRDNEFNFDFGVSFTAEQLANKTADYNYRRQDPGPAEREGASIFYKDPAGTLFHTYSTYARGIDLVNTAYNYLDLCPKGRDEGDRNQYWVKRRDEYPTD
jgi:predicted dithiol-disulfide oxidoreductase (DUF899 family)